MSSYKLPSADYVGIDNQAHLRISHAILAWACPTDPLRSCYRCFNLLRRWTYTLKASADQELHPESLKLRARVRGKGRPGKLQVPRGTISGKLDRCVVS